MKKTLLLLPVIILLLPLATFTSAVTITPSVQFKVGNETYTVNQTMTFYLITIDSSYIIFNATGFYVTSSNAITIKLVYINDDITHAVDGEKILDFYAATTSGNVWFNLSGFPAGTDYRITRDGTLLSTSAASGLGVISFSTSQWSTHRFQIYQQGEGTGDIIPPQISNIILRSSTPIDTGIGWENITCTVTDDVAVHQVSLHLTEPITTQAAMNQIPGTHTYYYNTTFADAGNYSYHIWADDISDNSVSSSTQLFSLPSNWDINGDGICTVIDYVLISNHYGQTGTPGWIREDVDNNGAIQVVDLVLISNHYDETWWE